MKVLHISTGQAGAGLCAEKIHRSLLALDVDSRMLVYSKSQMSDDKIDAPYNKRGILHFVMKMIRKIFRICNIPLLEEDKLILDSQKYHAFYSTPQTKLDITSHAWIEWADIIHLHWCNNFFDQPKFFDTIKNKPIIWTLHDENLFYGTAHYHDSILFDDKLEKKYCRIKHNMILKANNLSIVFLSQYFIDKFSDNEILKGKKIYKIYNSVETSQFIPQDLQKMRIELGLPIDKEILLFVATSITDRHKGLEILIEAVTKLNNNNLLIVAIGSNDGFCGHKQVLPVGRVSNPNILTKYYSAANAYVLPSFQESFSQSCIEALSCGVPIVAFPVGVCLDCINEDNGFLCCNFSVDELMNGIQWVLKRKYDKSVIRRQVEGLFTSSNIARQYCSVYEEQIEIINN